MRAIGAKRPRELFPSKHASVPWTGRVPKPAMNKDSWVDYGSGFLRKSCDSCVSSKRRCDGQDPCTRCLRRKKPCHYTERKKCGPRSGQKAKCAQASTATHPLPGEPKFRAHHLHLMNSATRALPAPSALDSGYPGLTLGGSLPPSHGTPSLSAGDLSGETTGVDLTDCSDAPPSQNVLSRDESGGSWWSVEEKGKASETAPRAAWNDVGVSCDLGSPEGHPHPDERHDGVDHSRKRCRYDSGGRWEGVRGPPEDRYESGGSGGSGCDSSEDDGSEESLGRAEEEVAALLVHLWRSEPFFEGFSGSPPNDARSSPADGLSTVHVPRSRGPKRCWDMGGIEDESSR